MEFKWTTGIWEIDNRASMRVRCNDVTIANCSQGQGGENEEKEKANALLISKSPKMLEMLNNIFELIESEDYVIQRNHPNAGFTNESEILKNRIEKLIKEATELQVQLNDYEWKRFYRTNGRWGGWHLCNQNNECKCGWAYSEDEFTRVEVSDQMPKSFVCIKCKQVEN